MARRSLWLIPVACLVVGWVGTVSQPAWTFAAAVLAGALTVGLVGRQQRAGIRSLSRDVNAWMGKVAVEPISVPGGHDAQELASAINALGAAYARRGQRVDEADLHLDSLVAALPEPAMLFEWDLTLAAANEGARELFKIAPGATTATQALGSAVFADLVRATVQTPELHRAEAKLGGLTIEASTTPMLDKILFLARDNTQQVRLEALRRDFVANASHELKSPVAAIQALADAISVVVNKDQTKVFGLNEKVRSEAERLAHLVDDLLSLRRVDERVSGEAAEVLDIARILDEAVTSQQSNAARRDITVILAVRPPAEVVQRVHADPRDLHLAFGNLIGNAIKYNRDGGRVDVSCESLGSDIVIEVSDTGIGIPGKDLGRVFERFHRVDEGRSRAAGGTGLGLSIVRHAVERNGGHVTVRSQLGVGTTFRVTLPALTPERTDDAQPS